MSAELIKKFYEAFQKRDAEGMVALYADDVVFSDPVFKDLRGVEAKNMWRMLCARGKDLKVTFRDVTDTSAHWDADYTFTATKKLVHNSIDATFAFRDGKIVKHTDVFDLYKWSAQALGLPGKLLGWSSFMQNTIRGKGRAGLDAWSKEHPDAR